MCSRLSYSFSAKARVLIQILLEHLALVAEWPLSFEPSGRDGKQED
jgi:hypothetical protein